MLDMNIGQLVLSLLLLLVSGLLGALMLVIKYIWNNYLEQQEKKEQKLNEQNDLINKRVDGVETSVNKFIARVDKANHDREIEFKEMNRHLEMVFLKTFPEYRPYFEAKEKEKLKRRRDKE